jgi:hypothetical protein
MTSLEDLRSLHRQVARLHAYVVGLNRAKQPGDASIPEHIVSGFLTLQLDLGRHVERYLTSQQRGAEVSREVCAWFARMAIKHWAETDQRVTDH